MNNPSSFQVGQRWKYKSPVAGFENTLVIASAGRSDAKTQWEVYVRYDPSHEWAPPGMDGVVLELTEALLARSVTELVASGIKLPWWWRWGKQFAKKSDAPAGTGALLCRSVSSGLRFRMEEAEEQIKRTNHRAWSIKKHKLEYKGKKKQARRSKSVAESWSRIAAWAKGNSLDYRMSPKATKKAIAAFENTIEAELPSDFKESLLLHDGCYWIPPESGTLSLKGIEKQWRQYRKWQRQGMYEDRQKPKEIKGPIKPLWWTPKRIFITDEDGDHLALDLDPAKGGQYGQIIRYSHEIGPVRVVASSWSGFLERMANALESGEYIYFEKEGSLERIEW